MTRYALALAAALFVAFLVLPDGATAAPTGVTCAGSGCYSDATGDLTVNSGASADDLEVELCLTTAAAYAPTSSYYLTGAKSLYVENRSAATCYLRFDAGAVTTTGSSGYKFAAGTERSFDISGTTFGADMRVACTAAQTTGACLFLGWWK